MHCAKNIRMTLQYFDVLLYKTFLFSFDLGFDIGSDSCTSKGYQLCLLTSLSICYILGIQNKIFFFNIFLGLDFGLA